MQYVVALSDSVLFFLLFTTRRDKFEHFFECFCEVVPPTPEKAAWIIQQFPDNYKDQEVLKTVPKFAYPCVFEKLVTFNQLLEELLLLFMF